MPAEVQLQMAPWIITGTDYLEEWLCPLGFCHNAPTLVYTELLVDFEETAIHSCAEFQCSMNELLGTKGNILNKLIFLCGA